MIMARTLEFWIMLKSLVELTKKNQNIKILFFDIIRKKPINKFTFFKHKDRLCEFANILLHYVDIKFVELSDRPIGYQFTPLVGRLPEQPAQLQISLYLREII